MFSNIHLSGLVSGGVLYGIVAYAVRTIPIPDNKYGKWLVGLVHFAFSNLEIAQTCFYDNKTIPHV